MQHRFFMISVANPTEAEAELNDFCQQQRIANIEKQFVADGANSFWSICVTWLTGSEPLAGKGKRKAKIDYKEILNDDDFTIYAQLRDLRKEIANREGTPAYNVFTNEQLAQIVQQRVSTKTALLSLEGVGKTRIKKYGDEFLEAMQAMTLPEPTDETNQNLS